MVSSNSLIPHHVNRLKHRLGNPTMLRNSLCAFITLLAVSACSAEKDVKPKRAAQAHITQALVGDSQAAVFQPMVKPQITEVTYFDDGQLLVLERKAENIQHASLFSKLPASPEKLSADIIFILKTVSASEDFIKKISPRLTKNRKLKKENFELALIDVNGEKYYFNYKSQIDKQFFTLNFYTNK